MELQIIELPIEVNELASKISPNKQAEVQTVLQQIFTGTDDWEKQVDAIEIKDINDRMSISLAETARKNSKQARLNAEKIFDAKREEVQILKSEFDLEDKLWLKAKQIAQIKFKAIEDKAEYKANFVKRFEAEQKELRTQKRINDVSKYDEINRIEFENMSDSSFDSFLGGLKSTYEAKLEAEKKAENERIERERLEAERIEKQRLENEKLKKEAEIRKIRGEELRPYIVYIRDYNSLINKSEDEYQKELSDIKKGIEEEREHEQKMAEKRFKEAKKRGEIIKKFLTENGYKETEGGYSDGEHFIGENHYDLTESEQEMNSIIVSANKHLELKKEKQSKAKLEAELKVKKDAEIKAEQNRKEAELKAKKEAEKLAKAPIKKQLSIWVDSFTISEPNNRTETTLEIQEKFNSFKNWAKSKIDNL